MKTLVNFYVLILPGILFTFNSVSGLESYNKGFLKVHECSNSLEYQAIKAEWQLYDINSDGRFDVSDIEELRENGWQGFEHDINKDGKKDLKDPLYLHVKLSVLDRNCDGIVNNEDFKSVARISFPTAVDVSEIITLVNSYLSGSAARLPSDIETRLLRSVPADKVLSPDEKAYLYQLFGISSLAQRNLDGAKWGFGKAFQIKGESSLPPGNLAFCLAMEGRYSDALLLLAHAIKIFPRSAATSTTIGWIFARHGQNDEARKYYTDAVKYSPQTGQYHFNLGVILLRLGNARVAWEEFDKASRLDPGDSKKFLFSYLTRPADIPPENRPLSIKELKEENSRLINEAKKSGWSEDELPVPWDQQSCCDQAMTTKEILELKYQKQIEEMAQVFSNNLAKEIETVIKPFMPEWKNFCKDWKRYIEGLPFVYENATVLTLNTSIAAGDERTALMRKMGMELLSHSSDFMSCAIKKAEADYKKELEKWEDMEDMIPAKTLAEIKSEAYKEVLKEAIGQCYKTPVNIAYGYMTAKSQPFFNLPAPEVETISMDQFFGLFMVMPLSCTKIEGYCDEKATCYTGKEKQPQTTAPGDVFSIDLWIVSFEYDANSGEWEFNVDLGITLGATWTPATGFGFQAGVDVSLGFIAGVEAGFYFKYDEGEFRYVEEAGLYTQIGPFSYTRQESGKILNFQTVPEER